MFYTNSTRLLAAASIIIGSLVFASTATNAAPVMPLQQIVDVSDADNDLKVELVKKRRKYLKSKKRRKARKHKKRRKAARKYSKRHKRHKRYKRSRRSRRIDAGDILLGVIIGSAIIDNIDYDRRVYLPRRHVNYCYRKYRSYRVYDNTFQPYRGRRRQCVSPYWP